MPYRWHAGGLRQDNGCRLTTHRRQTRGLSLAHKESLLLKISTRHQRHASMAYGANSRIGLEGLCP
jgi:hypothetical protein